MRPCCGACKNKGTEDRYKGTGSPRCIDDEIFLPANMKRHKLKIVRKTGVAGDDLRHSIHSEENSTTEHSSLAEDAEQHIILATEKRVEEAGGDTWRIAEFSVGDRVSVQLSNWTQAFKGIVKKRTATGYIVMFDVDSTENLPERHFTPEELKALPPLPVSSSEVVEQVIAEVEENVEEEDGHVWRRCKVCRNMVNVCSCQECDGTGCEKDSEGALCVRMSISLRWDTDDDLDIHVETPDSRQFINWNTPHCKSKGFYRPTTCGGYLELDANVDPNDLMEKPVENVIWETKVPREGDYIITIQNFTPRSSLDKETIPFKIVANGMLLEGQVSGKERATIKYVLYVDADGKRVKSVTWKNKSTKRRQLLNIPKMGVPALDALLEETHASKH